MLLLLACTVETADSPDLTVRLGAGQVRAGVITDEAALFGGISAEGQLGDIKIYNDRVAFVIQGTERAGHYYMEQAGGVVDADIVRPEGQLGRDMVDDWMGMYGVGRMADADTIVVVDDGRISGRAVVRTVGRESPMALVIGAVEDPGFVPDLGLTIQTDYILEPGSWLMEVVTTVTASDGSAEFTPGDMLMGSLDAALSWNPERGLEQVEVGTFPWLGFTGKRNDGAFALVAAPGEELEVSAAAALVASLADMQVGFGPEADLETGESVTFRRFYGVAPDLATLSDASYALQGAATEEVSGVVSAPDGPVAGAWVAISVDGTPTTVAITDADGAWSAQVPEGSEISTLVSGLGRGLWPDHGEGWAPYPAYAPESVKAAHLAGIADGALPVPEAAGRGVSTDGTLLEPAWIRISSADGLPFEAQVRHTAGEPGADSALAAGRVDGLAALAWATDGEVLVAVEPGEVRLLAHRGIRYEVDQQTLEVTAGETAEVQVTLEQAYAIDGWVEGDPHQHASPSGDGSCPMEDRLAVTAARGIQIHFGTDHDHVADYRPLVSAMDLDGILRSVVASEVSPVLRGHINAYPLPTDAQASNGGAYLWYHTPVGSTQEQFDNMAAQWPNARFQSNHPTSSGLAESADWEVGSIGDPDFWTEDFDAVEVMNAGTVDGWDFYVDLVNRGVLPTPTGVSDSHGPTSGQIGASVTFFAIEGGVAGVTDQALVDALDARATQVSRGPFLVLSETPGSTLTGPTTLQVEALSASWIVVDEIVLVRNGEEILAEPGTSATFDLDGDEDCWFTVIARGSQAMAPVFGSRTPWAMSSAILYDAAGDGWDPPMDPLTLD